MVYPANTISLYMAMMKLQKDGTFTEHSLLDFLPFFWYNGSYDEYYGSVYVRRWRRNG